MFKKSIMFLMILLVVLSLIGTGCSKVKGEKDISILYPNWAEGIAFTYLAKAALEAKGYKVKVTAIDPGPIYASLAKGDADLFFDAWLPNTHFAYWKKYGKKIDKLGEAFSEGYTGLTVPDYVAEKTIEDLKAVKDKYKGKIIGIGSGAGIHRSTLKAIKQYKLPFKQITSSGPAMIASLQKAYAKKAPIVITGWKPHFMFSRYKLRFLKDGKKVFPKDVMAILARKNFKKDHPEVAKFCANFKIPEKKLYDLMGVIKKADSPEKSAKKWYNKNKKLVDSWWN